jgi:hypothetical protein
VLAIGADPAVAFLQEVAQGAGGAVVGEVRSVRHGHLQQWQNVCDEHRGVVVLVRDHGFKWGGIDMEDEGMFGSPLTQLNARLDAVLKRLGLASKTVETRFGKMSDDTFKSVWRHYYKKVRKARGNLDKVGGGGQELPDGNKYLRNKMKLLWRGTHRGEVEKIAKGRFKSEWSNPYHPNKKRTYVAGSPQQTEMYAATAAAHAGNRGGLNTSRSLFPDEDTHKRILDHLGQARIIGVAPKALKRADHKVRATVGDYARTAPLRGGIAAREVRTLLKPRTPKPGQRRVRWDPVPLGEVMQRKFERG